MQDFCPHYKKCRSAQWICIAALIAISLAGFDRDQGPAQSRVIDKPPRRVVGDYWADAVIGKPDFSSLAPNEVTGARIFNGGGVIVDRSAKPNRLYAYD